ncbi:PAS domain S-box protein [Brevundimonas subvibrioides]|uniref:histidine kinase n=1 Tax=Brevundimonas subvibrioides (strain ATCC 15264 / DSM 4735 / LMG 14903 / NBRC 16000 / CB 81) TaxID=633149 RepID=D9QF32_BRESC|nr:PAS domain S-box protein [Brevundimonas subvibrioides]ADL00517.1 multi-sensor hybrid histidine kinase [Brevundimonas subvibrioides ATCC 15264]
MAGRIRAFDWAATPLGPISAWPQSLRTATGLLVASPIPMVMLWGADGVMIYNDAYSVFAGGRHPDLLGSKVREGWPEVADFNDNVMKVGLAGGTLAYRDQALTLHRHGWPEQVWMDLDYWPVPDESGAPAGVICTVTETTERNHLQARQAALLELNDAFRDLTDAGEIAYAGASILARALGTTRAGYGLVDAAAGTVDIQRDYRPADAVSLTGVVALADYGTFFPQLLKGEAVVIDDVATDPRTAGSLEAMRHLGVGSTVNIPLIEQGELVAIMYVGDVRPRHWTPAELALMREIKARVRTATERARTAAELADSEGRYRTLFDAMDEGFCIIQFVDGPDGPLSDYVHITANRAAAKHAGLAGVEGRSVRDLLGDEAADWVALYEEVLRTGRPIRVEHELKASGRWLEVAAFRIEPPERLQVAVLFKDLTARKAAETALRQSEAQFRAFTQAVPNHVWASRPDGEIYWYNDQVYAYTGHAIGDLDGTDAWAGVLHPDDAPGAAEAWWVALTTGQPYRAEFRIRRADGAWRWFTVSATPVRDADGQITGWVGANSDIDDIRGLNAQLEILLAGSKAERDRLWTLSADALARADYAGGLVAVNPAWTSILGWSEQELLTNPYANLINPDDADATLTALTRMGESGQAIRFENRILSKSGVWTPMGWTVTPEDDGVHFIAVGRDMTEDKAREAALAQAQEALRQSQKMEAVGQLTGGIAHDFNNLLAGISGALELLSKRLSEGRLNGMERYIDAAQGSAQRAASLTQRLLAFSRRQTLDPKPTDVNRLINGMEDLIRRSVGPDVEVEVVGAGGLWATRVDPSQLENALLNLCINGRDAMAPDGGRLTIETSNKWLDERAARERELAPGQYVSLCVTDTGSGMTPEVQAQAFDPFFTTKPLGQGTGLGLSMIHGFVRQSGGQVRIYSELGKGTTLCLYLPRYQGSVEAGEDVAATAVVEGGHGETVLVIDDEETVRMLVAEVLGEAGYNVIEAPDGPSGLDILRSDRRIDLLVSDVGLPGGMNGRQVADAARVTRPDLKVLFITGYAENAAVGNGLLAPGMEVLTKPFVMGDLAAKVHDMIEGPGGA